MSDLNFDLSTASKPTFTYEQRLVHSSRTLWHDKRNVEVSPDLTYTYQELLQPAVKSQKEDEECLCLGTGRAGRLDKWMRETEFGIEDAAGELRGDSRPIWTVLYFPASKGIDVFYNGLGNSGLSNEFMQELGLALSQTHGLGDIQLHPVTEDEGRKEERKARVLAAHKAWEKRTGAEEGISPDLVYDDDVPDRKNGKCGKCCIQ